MTFKERMKREKPENVSDIFTGGVKGCPWQQGYEDYNCKIQKAQDKTTLENICRACWERETR